MTYDSHSYTESRDRSTPISAVAHFGAVEIRPWGKGGALIAQLPHQCDDWEIGGVEDLRALIADAQQALDYLEGQQ